MTRTRSQFSHAYASASAVASRPRSASYAATKADRNLGSAPSKNDRNSARAAASVVNADGAIAAGASSTAAAAGSVGIGRTPGKSIGTSVRTTRRPQDESRADLVASSYAVLYISTQLEMISD